MKARLTLIVVTMFTLCNPASAEECDIAKLSYLLEKATYHGDKYAFDFALQLGANPDGVTEKLAVKCFHGLPNTPPVLSAATLKDTYFLKSLLERGASPDAACCDTTALHSAIVSGNAEGALLLRQYGAK
jgi:hypothetical protein